MISYVLKKCRTPQTWGSHQHHNHDQVISQIITHFFQYKNKSPPLLTSHAMLSTTHPRQQWPPSTISSSSYPNYLICKTVITPPVLCITMQTFSSGRNKASPIFIQFFFLISQAFAVRGLAGGDNGKVSPFTPKAAALQYWSQKVPDGQARPPEFLCFEAISVDSTEYGGAAAACRRKRLVD